MWMNECINTHCLFKLGINIQLLKPCKICVTVKPAVPHHLSAALASVLKVLLLRLVVRNSKLAHTATQWHKQFRQLSVKKKYKKYKYVHGQSQSITPLTTAHLYAFFHKALSFHVFIQRYRSINQKGAKRSNYDECGADAPFSLIAMKDFLWNSTSAEWAVASPYQKRWRCVSVIMNHIPSSLTMGCDPLLRSS